MTEPAPYGARRFEGAVALVTGAGSGIGQAAARRLAAEGAKIAVLDIQAAAAGRTAAEIGAQAIALTTDVSDAASVAAAVDACTRAFGAPTVLLNVAGVPDTSIGPGLEQIDLARWNRTLAVNLTGPFLLAKAVLPAMVQAGRGAIVNVSSLAGRSKSTNATAAYSASKAGLLGLTRHLAFDYGPLGIRTNAICPGGVDTPMIRAAAVKTTEDPEEKARRKARIAAHQHLMPIKRLSSPEEQAAAMLFLASPDAAYINGVALDVNGGMYMA